MCLRFLREDPWRRLERLRELIPNVPFQMLLRGANAVGYTSYPDNVVYEFCREAAVRGVDVFRVFDSLNYVENLLVGCDAVHAAGGVVQGEVCFTGNLDGKYSLDYYLGVAGDLVHRGGVHVLGVKDMAGLMTPAVASRLVGALKREFPCTPLHVHTHDTGGVGVASMVAAAAAGADVVHGAVDCLSGGTSQPSLGALVKSLGELQGGALDVDLGDLAALNDYWAATKARYAPFAQAADGASDVWQHEMPGGQYTNLRFQSQSILGSGVGEWGAVKGAYREANALLGDLVKVTPSSKAVGDLAVFMVANGLGRADVEAGAVAGALSLPASVVEFLQGQLGQPHGGFPEPLRSAVMAKEGLAPLAGRPGAGLPPFDFGALRARLAAEYGGLAGGGFELRPATDALSAALYPEVFAGYATFCAEFGDVSRLPTEAFLAPLAAGQEVEVHLDAGKLLVVKYLGADGEADGEGRRAVRFELNGVTREVRVLDKQRAAAAAAAAEEGGGRGRLAERGHQRRADRSNPGHVSAPMPGTLLTVRCKAGDVVAKGQQVAVVSAMKMETAVSAPVAGTVVAVHAVEGDLLRAGDLVVEIE